MIEDLAPLLETPLALAIAIVLGGLVLGYVIGRLNERLLRAARIPSMVEGTPFERTAQSIGTSTVGIVARLSSWFIYGIAFLTAVHVLQPFEIDVLVEFLPQLFVALLVLIGGFVVADKAELMVSEYLRSVKLPEVSLIPKAVKYSVLFVVFLLALAQVNVNVDALLILLTIYAVGIVVVGTISFRHFLVSSAAGIYLLINQPYGIGDEIRIGDRQGIVQEVDLFVTKFESNGEEYVVLNRELFEEGVVRIRE